MSSRKERVIDPQIGTPNLERAPVSSPIDYLKNRFNLLVSYNLPLESSELARNILQGDAEKRKTLWQEEMEMSARRLGEQEQKEHWKQNVGSKFDAILRPIGEIETYNRNYDMFPNGSYDWEKMRAYVMRSEYKIESIFQSLLAELFPERSKERQRRKEVGESADNLYNALTSTINQVDFLTSAESLSVASKERQGKEGVAQTYGREAKVNLYLARQGEYEKIGEEWARRRAQQERDKRTLAAETATEIEFPAWLINEIEKLELEEDQNIPETEENQAEDSDEEKLRRIALKQVKRFAPDLTPDQAESIIPNWMVHKKDELIRAEEEWNNEVKTSTIWAEDDRKAWRLNKLSDRKLQEPAMKEAYKKWTEPARLERELTEKKWGKAIVMELYIP